MGMKIDDGGDLETRLISVISPPTLQFLPAGTRFPFEDDSKMKKIIKEFLEDQQTRKNQRQIFINFCKDSKENFIEFVDNLEKAWKHYITLVSYMDILSPTLKNLYPAKIDLLEALVKQTYEVNQFIYFATDLEKEIYQGLIESMKPERAVQLLTSIRSFPVYLGVNFKDLDGRTLNEFNIRAELLKNPRLNRLLKYSGDSIDLLINTIKESGKLNTAREKENFIPENKYEEALQKILAYDHFIELFLRKSGILKLDAKFYQQACKVFSKKQGYRSLLEGLEGAKQRLKSKTVFNIPRYKQNTYSCGVACLMNVLGCFYPEIKLNRRLEDELFKVVTTKGYLNNIPTSLARVAREKYGIDATFVVDLEAFKKKFIENPKMQQFPPLVKFNEDYQHVPVEDIKGLTQEDMVRRLSEGKMFAYVGQYRDILHYKLIYGFKVRNGKTNFFVFDPLLGESKIEGEHLYEATRNSEGFWGVEYSSPENSIFNSIYQEINDTRENLKWEEHIISTSKI